MWEKPEGAVLNFQTLESLAYSNPVSWFGGNHKFSSHRVKIEPQQPWAEDLVRSEERSGAAGRLKPAPAAHPDHFCSWESEFASPQRRRLGRSSACSEGGRRTGPLS